MKTTEEKILDIIANQIGMDVEDLQHEATLYEQGAAIWDVVEIEKAIRDEFKIRFNLGCYAPVGSVIRRVKDKIATKAKVANLNTARLSQELYRLQNKLDKTLKKINTVKENFILSLRYGEEDEFYEDGRFLGWISRIRMGCSPSFIEVYFNPPAKNGKKSAVERARYHLAINLKGDLTDRKYEIKRKRTDNETD